MKTMHPESIAAMTRQKLIGWIAEREARISRTLGKRPAPTETERLSTPVLRRLAVDLLNIG